VVAADCWTSVFVFFVFLLFCICCHIVLTNKVEYKKYAPTALLSGRYPGCICHISNEGQRSEGSQFSGEKVSYYTGTKRDVLHGRSVSCRGSNSLTPTDATLQLDC